MQKIVPNLWFDKEAEEAVDFYIKTFGNGQVDLVTRHTAESAQASGQPEGSVLTVDFQLFGQRFLALNGGPLFKFTEAVSLAVDCDTQEEVDRYWSALTADGGQESQCGWLKDKYGLSWQIVPSMWNERMKGDPKKAQAMMAAMLQMQKLDIATLEAAYNNA